jgi:hypothetical protein
MRSQLVKRNAIRSWNVAKQELDILVPNFAIWDHAHHAPLQRRFNVDVDLWKKRYRAKN